MEYVVLLSLVLLCYGWLGNRERIESRVETAPIACRREAWEEVIGLEFLIMGIVSLLVGIYLVVALLRPDKF